MSAEFFFNKGVDNYKKGEYEKALQDWSKSIELNPQDSEAYYNRGILHMNHFQEYEKALQDYSKAIELNPQDSEAYYSRGILHVNHFQEYEKALQDWSKSIELNPQFSKAYYNRGILHDDHFQEYEKALQDCSKAIELNPQDSEAYYNRGILHDDHFQDYEKALQDYSKSIELNPQFSETYCNRGNLFMNHFQEYEKALQDYSKVIELNPQDSETYYNRGILFTNHFQEYEKALQDYSKSIELNPQDSETYYNRGILHENHFQEYEKALQDYSKAIELNPQKSNAYYNRGILLCDHFQEYEKAILNFSKVIEFDPEFKGGEQNCHSPEQIQYCQQFVNKKEKERVIILQDQLKEPSSCSFEKSFPILRERVEGKLILQKLEKQRDDDDDDDQSQRVSLKIEEVGDRRYCTTHPTHSFVHDQKLDFDVTIGSSKQFASKFSPRPSVNSNVPSHEQKKYRFDDLSSEKGICDFFESVVVDFENDEELRDFLERLRREFQTKLEDERKRLKSVEFLDDDDPIFNLVNSILLRIALFFIPINSSNQIDRRMLNERWGNLKKYLRDVREKRKNNSVYLGELKNRCGACRHRSTLCKVVCDELGIRCRLISVTGYHAWNVIWIKDKFFIVDLMNYWRKGLIKLDDPLEYRKTKDSPVEKMSFLQLQKKVVEDLNEKRRFFKEYSSIMETLEDLIMKEEIRKQREKFFKLKFETNRRSNMRLLDVKKGGFGKISNFVLDEVIEMDDKSLLQTLKTIGDSGKVVLFRKDEKISVKQIRILQDEEEEGEEEEEEEEMNVTNAREGMERKYSLKEKNFMRILDHPYIIKSLGSFEFEEENQQEQHLCILMKSMEKDGGSFLSLLKKRNRNNPMTLERKFIEVLYFLIDASQGLQYMHRMNIIHLDFKLENIMVNWDPKKKKITELKIIDFGGAKETDYRTSTVLFTTNKNDSPEVYIQKRRRNVKRTMKSLRSLVNENNGKVDDENEMDVNERIDEIMEFIVGGIPGRYKETPKVLAQSLKSEIEFILQLEKDNKDFVHVNDNRKNSLRENRRKKVRKKDQESSLLRFDERADVFSFGKIIEKILENVKVPSNSSEGLKAIVKDLRRIRNSCLKEKKEERPTMEGIMVALLAQWSLTVFPPSE